MRLIKCDRCGRIDECYSAREHKGWQLFGFCDVPNQILTPVMYSPMELCNVCVEEVNAFLTPPHQNAQSPASAEIPTTPVPPTSQDRDNPT